MDKLETYRQIVEKVLNEYANIPYNYGEVKSEAIFDRVRDRYILLDVGWEDKSRIHATLIHVDIIDGKIWVQEDNTDRPIARELLKAGIPNTEIVLAFHHIEKRPFTEFAVA